MPRKAVKAKPKPKGKKQQVARGRDIAQFRGTGAQVIVQIPRTRRARAAPVRQARAAAVMPQPMISRPVDALTGQQTASDRIQQQLGVLQDTLSRTRSEQASRIEEGQQLIARDLGERINDIERNTRNLQQQLVAEQSRLGATRGPFDMRGPDSMRSMADTPRPGGGGPPLDAELQRLGKEELKDMLRQRSLPVSGNKPDLIKRLQRGF